MRVARSVGRHVLHRNLGKVHNPTVNSENNGVSVLHHTTTYLFARINSVVSIGALVLVSLDRLHAKLASLNVTAS